jgi:TolB protein
MRGGIFTVAAGLALAVTATAQDVVVSKSGGEKSSMDWSGFAAAGAAGATFAKVAQADLERSGWFRLTTGAGEIRVSGEGAEAGGRLRVKCVVVNAGSGAQVLGKSYEAGLAEVRALAHRVADEIVKAVTGRDGFASSKLVLVGNRTGKKELYLCDSDGANLVQLTQDRGISLFPRWGGENQFITYTGYLRGFPAAYRIQLATGRREQLAGFPGLNSGAVMSPDGRSVALVLSRDGNPELYVQTPPGGALTRVTRTPKGAESSPSWSPNGAELCYVSDVSGKPQLYIVSRAGGTPRRVTSRGIENVAPNWGAHGKIAYASKLGARFHICVLDPATMAVTPFAFEDADYEDPSWARDGRHVACARTVAYRSGVCLIDTMGGEKLTLVSERGDWFSPAWSR